MPLIANVSETYDSQFQDAMAFNYNFLYVGSQTGTGSMTRSDVNTLMTAVEDPEDPDLQSKQDKKKKLKAIIAVLRALYFGGN